MCCLAEAEIEFPDNNFYFPFTPFAFLLPAHPCDGLASSAEASPDAYLWIRQSIPDCWTQAGWHGAGQAGNEMDGRCGKRLISTTSY